MGHDSGIVVGMNAGWVPGVRGDVLVCFERFDLRGAKRYHFDLALPIDLKVGSETFRGKHTRLAS